MKLLASSRWEIVSVLINRGKLQENISRSSGEMYRVFMQQLIFRVDEEIIESDQFYLQSRAINKVNALTDFQI